MMSPGHCGVLSLEQIEQLIADRAIDGNLPIDKSQLQPASLDLRLGVKGYRIRASFLTGPFVSVQSKLDSLGLHTIDLLTGTVLDVGCVYIIPLVEHFHLPPNLTAYANTKSSTGRINVFTRLVVDMGKAFDIMPPGYSGPAYIEVSPRSFPILARHGSRLNQLRFHAGDDSIIPDDELVAMHTNDRLVSTENPKFEQGLHISVDLSGNWPNPKQNGVVGYRAKRYTNFIDVDAVNELDALEFWSPIKTEPKTDGLILDPGEFYILASKESIRISPSCVAEMVPFDHRIGEFRVHYAGFFDPGFGCNGIDKSAPTTRAVLEVSSREVPFILNHRQTVGRLVFSKMQKRPRLLYGRDVGSNYQNQALRLSKHFRT